MTSCWWPPIWQLATNVVRLTTHLSHFMDAGLGFAPERCKIQVGLHGEGETLVPIPNTKVKPFIGYNTTGFAGGKIARGQIIE